MKKFFKECAMPCKAMVVILVAFSFALLNGCAGSVKTTKPDGTKISTPAAVAVMEASALAHDTCAEERDIMAEFAGLNCNDPSLKEGGQEECYQTKQMAMFAVALTEKDNGERCHAQIASEAKAYFASQAGKYNMWGSIGRAGIWGGVTVFGIKSFTGMVDGAISAAGDEINTGNINVTKSDDPMTGGEGGGDTGGIGGQTVTIGSGSVASGERSAVIDSEKAINFPGDSNMDADGTTAGTTGVTLDDSGDGGGNSILPEI